MTNTFPSEMYYVWDGRMLYLPYSGSLDMDSKEAAERVVIPNAHLGYAVVKMKVEIDECPHDWDNVRMRIFGANDSKCKICGIWNKS